MSQQITKYITIGELVKPYNGLGILSLLIGFNYLLNLYSNLYIKKFFNDPIILSDDVCLDVLEIMSGKIITSKFIIYISFFIVFLLFVVKIIILRFEKFLPNDNTPHYKINQDTTINSEFIFGTIYYSTSLYNSVFIIMPTDNQMSIISKNCSEYTDLSHGIAIVYTPYILAECILLIIIIPIILWIVVLIVMWISSAIFKCLENLSKYKIKFTQECSLEEIGDKKV